MVSDRDILNASMANHKVSRLLYILKLLGVAALYALLAKIVLTFFSANGVVSIVWPPSGLALAVLLIGGNRYFPGVFLGAFLANAMTGLALGVAASIAMGNTLEALLGAWLLTRDGKFDSNLRALGDYLRLVVLGGFVACSVAALNGSTTLLVSGFITTETYFPNLLNWWMGDALGIVLITPLILVWRRTPDGWLEPKRMAEAMLLLGMMFLANQIVFLGWFHGTAGVFEQVARGYWMFLLVTWVAVRLGTHGVVIALIVTAIQALLSAALGVGFFAGDMAKTGLVNYWFYIVVLSVVGMALATYFTERKQLEQQLSRRLRHRDIMERISQISLNSTNIEELLGRVLDEMQAIFNADRAWFLYPCDPDAPSWSVPMERTRPEWPGAFARGMVIPMAPEVAEVFREVLASTKPLPYGPAASRFIPAAVAEQFSIRSQIQMALRPKVGSPWTMGLHHCAQARAYDEDDLLIFNDIGQRVADALSSMIILKNLRESEENLNRAQAVGQVGSWFLDIPTNRLEWSAETYRMFGIPQQEAVDLETFVATIHPDDRDFVLKTWGEAVAGAPYDIEHRIVVDGQARWVRERAQVEYDSEGRPLAGIGTVQDVTERKQADKALWESGERFRDITDNSPAVIFLKDMAGHYLHVNRRYEKLFHVDNATIQGKTDHDLFPHDMADAFRKGDQAVAQSGIPIEIEERVPQDDGIHTYISVKFPLRNDFGEIYAICGIATDITERKEYEEELKRSNVELEQFSYVVSHDMRQPLRMISSYLQLLEMSLSDQLVGERRGYFDIAIDGAKRIDQMLVALLEYSRVGKMGEPPTWIESRAMLDEALQFLQPAITEAQAKLNISGDWPQILVSHDEILRLLQNLIGNAAKYRIAGRIPEITVTSEMVKNEWHLCVADNGVGIIPDQIKRLFKVFQRLQTRTAYEGTGIGLALCRKIAEHHKGRLWAESAGEGQGSKFCVVLPVPQEKK